MYHGKHEKPASGMKKYKKSGILLASLVLIFALVIGTTVAFLIDQTNTVVNEFQPVKVTTNIEEKFEHNEKSSVIIHNTGDVPAYIRATVVTYWTLADSEQIVAAPIVYNFSMVTADGWVKQGDIYYYTSPVSVGGGVELLGAPVIIRNIPDGYTFHMKVLAEAIQADGVTSNGVKAVVDAWGVDPSTLGN